MSAPTQAKAPAFKPLSSFPLRLSLPAIYPETREKPFIFHLRVQLVEDAEEAQKNFIALPDDQKKGDRFHQFDVEMLAALSTAEPEGFPDFPQAQAQNDLPARMRDYFYPQSSVERREGMSFICRRAMALYWQAIQPEQYL